MLVIGLQSQQKGPTNAVNGRNFLIQNRSVRSTRVLYNIVYTGNIQRKERIHEFTMILFGNKLTLYITNSVILVYYTLLAD